MAKGSRAIAGISAAILCAYSSWGVAGRSEESIQPAVKLHRWTVDSFGRQAQCGASRTLDPSHPSQFAIGLTKDGSYLTLQNLQWRLPKTSTNMMDVELTSDGSQKIKTEALLISQIHAFQVFSSLMPVTEREFWRRLLTAQSVTVTGPFRPGKVTVDLSDSGDAIQLLRECAKQYLPNRELPF